MAKLKRRARSPRNQMFAAGLARSPAYPLPPKSLVAELQRAVGRAECQPGWQLSQLHFGRVCGLPPATVNDWLYTDHAARFISFICALERLSEEEMKRLFRRVCRPCPRLSDPEFAHDPATVRTFEALLRRPTGLTLLLGGSDAERTRVFTAIGNSAYRVNQRLRICGLDLHTPVGFSPVPGLLYLQQGTKTGELHRVAAEVWPLVAEPRANVVLLNRVWSEVPELRPAIQRLAAEKPVILADELDPTSLNHLSQAQADVRIVKVCSESLHSRIRLHIEFKGS